eukprot:3555420-Rhodomonas_salina.2
MKNVGVFSVDLLAGSILHRPGRHPPGQKTHRADIPACGWRFCDQHQAWLRCMEPTTRRLALLALRAS